MTQSVLKALMRLFAFVAYIYPSEDVSGQKKVVELFLKLYVRDKEIYQFTMMFDFYLKSLKQKKTDINQEKKISLFSVKSMLICDEINKKLSRQDKSIIILYTIEIAFHERSNSKMSKEFLRTISLALKIITSDFENTMLLVQDLYEDILNSKKLLLVTDTPIKQFRHQIIEENLAGKIVVLQYRASNIYVFRYIGQGDQLYLNNREIIPNRSYIFNKGAFIQNPKIAPIYYSDIVRAFLREARLEDFSISANEVEFYFPNSADGIQKINFSAISGQLIGIMGGSGVGKSTFLNVLNGSLKPNSGNILINGFDIQEEREKVKGIIGFIPQDDLLIEELTVFENLYFNARLCFDKLSTEKIKNLVNKTLEDLGLLQAKDLVVGSPLKKFISGGQRKRLNIALELIREPYILLVDEPTSGLSSRDSENVMELFKDQTLKGKIVIINIHQPSSTIFKQFDKLLVFDKGGSPVYYGNPVESVVYFKNQAQLINASESECLTCGNVNPEQVLNIIETTTVNESGLYTNKRAVSPTQWYSMYKKNIESQIDIHTTKIDLPKNNFNIPDKKKQFKIFTLRNYLTKISDKQYLLINLLEAPLLALILGFFTKNLNSSGHYIFSQNENLPAYLFMSIIVALFLGMMVSAEEIIRDRKILKRESFLNLSWSSYLNSKIVLLFAISAIQTLTFVLLGNTILGIKGMYFSYWLVLFSTACFSNMIGLNISASLKSVVSIYITIPLLLVPQLLFAGVIVKFDKLHNAVTSQEVVPVIGDIMVSRWSYEALAVNQFKNNRYEKLFFDLESHESQAAFNMNYYIPEIITKAYFCKKYHNDPNYRSLVSNELDIIKSEIKKLQKQNTTEPFNYMGSLTISSFNNEVGQYTLNYLNTLKKQNARLLENYIYMKDTLINDIIKKYDDRESFLIFKDKYYNNSLSDQVLNKMEKTKIVEVDGKLIQKAEPIFKAPDKNNGRAHFYSPTKKIGNISFSTYIFNVFIIWVITGLLYLSLINNGFIKVMKGMEKIKNWLLNLFILKKIF